VGLVFPRADRPIAVEVREIGLEGNLVTLRPIEGLEFVQETVTALGYSGELVNHLFRECWAVGTGSGRTLGWTGKEIEAHKFKVAMAADLVAVAESDRRPKPA
jgi:hypothetical protein